MTIHSTRRWVVVLVENEARRVFELFDALTVVSTGKTRAHAVDRPDLALGERILPLAILVGKPEEWGQADDLREDYPEFRERIFADRGAYSDVEVLYQLLDRIVSGNPHAHVLVLWDDQLNTAWALDENKNGMTLQFAARYGELLLRAGRKERVRIVGISAQKDWTTEQKADLARFLRRGWIDDFRDRAHIDRLVAELTGSSDGERIEYEQRLGSDARGGTLDRADLEGLRAGFEAAARDRLRAVARRVAQDPDDPVEGTWNPAHAGPLLIDETTRTIEVFEHRDRPAWALEGGWDAPAPATGKRRPATQVLKEITARNLAALRAGGEAEADAWEWHRVTSEDAALAFDSVAYRMLRFIARRGDAVESHEIVRAELAMPSAVNTYASRIRSGLKRHEVLESVTSGGYRCARDYLLLLR
ncbi:MAG: hypothetical protein AAF682_17460 [Planctomycetota bacterium]